MISFHFETEFKLSNEKEISKWITEVITLEKCKEGEINYIFCNDEFLLKINQDYLKHDTYTDIISFDFSVGKELHGDIFISVERVIENASEYKVDFIQELNRVMIHGILHYCGYKDKTEEDKIQMRAKEDHYISLRDKY